MATRDPASTARLQRPLTALLPEGMERVTNPLLPPRGTLDRLEHFDPDVFDMSPESHLMRYLRVILGDAGVGQLHKFALLKRLDQTVQGIRFQDIDQFYGSLFQIPRADTEELSLDPTRDLGTSSQWMIQHARDGSYRSRVTQFAHAVNHGPTVLGLTLAVEALLNVDCELFEMWRYHDDPSLYTVNRGRTPSRREIVVRPTRQISLLEEYTLNKVLTRLTPADTLLTIDTTGLINQTEVALRRVATSSEFWEVVSRVPDIRIGTATPYGTGSGDLVELPRPPLSGYQGEAWSYNADVTEINAYSKADADPDTPEVPDNFAQIMFHDGSSTIYGPERALFSAQELITGRIASDGIAVINPYSGRRRSEPAADFYVDHISIEQLTEALRSQSSVQERPSRNDFWATPQRPQSDERIEYLEIDFAEVKLINRIALDVAHFPQRASVEVLDEDVDEWVEVGSQVTTSSLPARFTGRAENFRLHPNHYGPAHWRRFRANFRPRRAQSVRVALQRGPGEPPLNEHKQVTSYSLGVRNMEVGYRVQSRADLPWVEDGDIIATSVDRLGSRVKFAYGENDVESVLVDDDSVWRSEPQVVKDAVVNLYVDTRDPDGLPQTISRFYLDPLTEGVSTSLYYTNEEPTGDFDPSDDPIPVTETGTIDVRPGFLDFDDTAPAYLDIDGSSIEMDITRPWWFGVRLFAMASSDDPDRHPILSLGADELVLEQIESTAKMLLDGTDGTYASTPDPNMLDADTAHLEQSAGGWTASGTNIQMNGITTEVAHFGSSSLEFEYIADGDGTSTNQQVQAGEALVPVSPGVTYSGGLWLYLDTAAALDMRIRLREYLDGSHVRTGSAEIVTVSPGEWVFLSLTHEAASDINELQLFIECQDGTYVTGDRFFIGAAIVREGTDPTFVPSLSVPEDLDVRWFGAADDWAGQTLVAQQGDQRSWMFHVDSQGGALLFKASPDGGSGGTAVWAVSPNNGERIGWRATREAATGEVRFYEADDPYDEAGTTWSLLGWDSTFVGNLHRSNSDVEVGQASGWQGGEFAGEVTAVQIRNGIDGPILTFARFESQTAGTTEFEGDGHGHTWTLHGNAEIIGVPGLHGALTYRTDASEVVINEPTSFSAHASLYVVLVHAPEATEDFEAGLTLMYRREGTSTWQKTHLALEGNLAPPDTIRVMGSIGTPADIGGHGLQALVLKEEEPTQADIDAFDGQPYLSRPEFSTDPGTVLNSLLRIGTSLISDTSTYGVRGGIPDRFALADWTPVARAYRLTKGMLTLPPVRARYWKFEFTNLAIEPYENFLHVEGNLMLHDASATRRYEHTMASREAYQHIKQVRPFDANTRRREFLRLQNERRPGQPLPTALTVAKDHDGRSRLRHQSWLFGYINHHAPFDAAPTFEATGQHRYMSQSLQYDTKVAFFVGLRFLTAYVVDPLVEHDDYIYEERFRDDARLALNEWTFTETGLYADTVGGQAVSDTYLSETPVEALQFAATNSSPKQLLSDPGFDDEDFLTQTDWEDLSEWHAFGSAFLTYRTNDHSVLVERTAAMTYGRIEQAYGEYGTIEPTEYGNLETEQPGGDAGGIESPPIVLGSMPLRTFGDMETEFGTYGTIEPNLYGQLETKEVSEHIGTGRIYAATRISVTKNIVEPIFLQLVDQDGTVLSEQSVLPTAGEITTLWIFHDYDTPPDEIRARVMQKVPSGEFFYVLNISIFEPTVVWEFSVDGGANWYRGDGVANNPNGALRFPTPGKELRWRVTAYNPQSWVSALQIRPWYINMPREKAEAGVRGPDIAPFDDHPPIHFDPMFQQWSLPIPRWWYQSV